jgi:hypothetical protein
MANKLMPPYKDQE